MALAITDDHHAQERAFYESPGWQRSPQALREQLTEREIDAATDALAKFVGIEAYVAAGGGVRRDLFSDNIQGGYLSDGALLERLARDKLAAAAEEARAEGWAWVDAVPRMTAAQLHGFQHARRERRMPNKTQAKRITKLQARQQAIENRLNSDEAEDLPEAEAQALYDESDQIEAELDGIEQTLMMFAPETLAIAGTIVTVDHLGNVAVHRGLLREADAKAFRARSAQHVSRASHGPAQGDDDHDPHHQHEQHSDGHDDDNPDATLASGISEKLARRLSAHRTAALQFEVARHPQVALVALVQRLALRVLFDAYDMRASPVNINATSQRGLDAYAPEVAQSASVTSLHALHQTWRDRLPEEPDALFTVLLGLSQEELLALLAVCVASTVNAVTHEDGDIPAAALAQAVGLDMHAWWTPTAESYFSHVSKANILAVVESVDPLQVNRLSKLKKDALASEAERLIQGSGWLPVMLCSPALRAPEILAMEVETVH
jgi:ParB family chromosome partitioning protein